MNVLLIPLSVRQNANTNLTMVDTVVKSEK